MTLSFILQNVRRYGVRGIIDYVLRQRRERAFLSFLRQSKRAAPPEPGITVIAGFDQPFSLSKTMRDFAIMLRAAKIPCQVLNIPGQNPIPDSEYRHLLTPREEFVANRYTDIISLQQVLDIGDNRCRAHAVEFWEFEDGMIEAKPEMGFIRNLIAMSDFDHVVFSRLAHQATVRKILYPFQFNHGPLASISETRRKYGIPPNAFMAFFNFDFSSSYFRKNPEAILRAFRKAFDKSDRAVLVFKTMRAKRCAAMNARLHALARELDLEKQLVTIDDFIPQEDLVNLTHACDTYISLHRGEGFGLGIAEAMALGKPVIVTDYASTTEFCRADNALPVPYRLIPVRADEHDIDAYDHVTRWADADTDAAARALRRLYDDPSLRVEIGTKAMQSIAEQFSVSNFKKSIEAFLHSR